MRSKVLFITAVATLLAVPGFGATFGVDLGSGGPGGTRPGTIPGGPACTSFDRTCQIAQTAFSTVTGVCADPVSATDTLDFSPSMQRRGTGGFGGGWATWSGSPVYTGPVYFQSSGGTATRLTLPDAGLPCFGFYVEPNSFSTFTFTVTTDDGTALVLPATGFSGAHGFGFYTDDGSNIVTVDIRTTSSTAGYSIAEFCGCSPGPPTPPPGSCDLTEIEAKLDAIEVKIDTDHPALEGKLDAMEGKLDAVEGKADAIEGKLDAIEGKLDAIEVKLDAMDPCEIVRLLVPLHHRKLPTDHPCFLPE